MMATMKKLSVQDVDLQGRKVLMRVDFNVPFDQVGAISDDTRIRSSLSTIEFIRARGGRPILMSHLGRPKGETVPSMSLRPVAQCLEELLGAPVHFIPDCVGEEARASLETAPPEGVILLENLRFHPQETANDPDFAAELAKWGEVYVNDAFGTAHRAHASTVGVTEHFELRVSGLLMDKELQNLGALLDEPERPYVAVLGGAKVSSKIGVIANLLDRVDSILIGGGMAFSFFRVHGLEVGRSLVEEELLDTVRDTLEQAKESRTKLILPQDLIVSAEFSNDAEWKEVLATDIPENWQGLDIGARTSKLYGDIISEARTVFWNGPMGVFEMPNFAKGTRAIARAMSRATGHGARTVVGGGDSVAAINELDLGQRVTHVSTGGGASLELLAGASLPGVDALSDVSSTPV
jgi:phosphoglycerate kinase